ncbi:N-terminal fungal transcription regulatory domain-containing protein (zinc finger protein) [Apiospora arundinis]|uniref:N-terminal fungal transcription regulatory domain-containing protein (Zinc finger protein) n=1 Tax=Apiospora arundinis TaxID=335852 RepID=A0ABR2J3X1_9PEZI
MQHVSAHYFLTIFRPFLLGPQRDQKLRIFTSANSSPGTIYEASITQMKQIVLQHHLDYPGKLFPNFAFAGYIHLCSAIAGTTSSVNSNAMNKSQRREQQFYFDICMCLFQDAYLQHELALPVAQGLIYMALQSNLIRASKARKILNQFQERGEHHQHYSSLLLGPKMTTLSSPYTSTTTTPPKMRAQIIVNFELAVTDVGAAQARSLVSKLEDSGPLLPLTMKPDSGWLTPISRFVQSDHTFLTNPPTVAPSMTAVPPATNYIIPETSTTATT